MHSYIIHTPHQQPSPATPQQRSMTLTIGVKLNRHQVAQDIWNLAWAPENTEDSSPADYWNLEYFLCKVSFWIPRIFAVGNSSENGNFCSWTTWLPVTLMLSLFYYFILHFHSSSQTHHFCRCQGNISLHIQRSILWLMKLKKKSPLYYN